MNTKKQAILVKDNLPKFRGHAALYKMNPPLVETNYEGVVTEHAFVVVSATDVMYSGPETYIFAADQDGHIEDGGELDGSYRGGLDHDLALANAGYEVATSDGTHHELRS